MEEPRKLVANAAGSARIPDRGTPLRPPPQPLPAPAISNRSYSIKSHRKKRKRVESTVKVTCLDCRAVTAYQTGDYVRCPFCNSNRFSI